MPSSKKILVTARGLTKNFNGRKALKGIDFELFRGECFGFLGPNGAGKTTTILMMLGLVEKTSGTLQVFDMSVPDDLKQIKTRVGVVPQNDNLDTDLTVKENLLTYASYYGMEPRKAAAKADELLRFFALSSRENEIIQHLSGGQRRRLLLARSLVHSPELLVLDEPTVGLDPQARHLIWDRLKELKEQGTTMLLTSHYMDEVSRLSDRVLILDHGKIVAQGEPRKMITDLVGTDVFEVSGQRADLDALERQVLSCEARTERFAGSLFIYTREHCPELEDLIRPTAHWIRRPANLEDLFIHLTGRSLRES
ncbi:MAG: ATP-binding cassette domain-containing protein [Desulfobulbaceae bacterium]|nr:ATP-binding cassette domain-containing protein [Desulfobulbaceae bacterium]MCK5341033.1 ATP-binding cassette domain-containing protein [Desulfobulbaceae bacterium]MCK5403620.1 ATP-binding cassette domain-containing protein [Desulfobulbaceae bacterium]